MAEQQAPSWSITGDYFENCNCTVVCPCLVSSGAPLTANPTEGVCEIAFAFHLDQGRFGDVSLDDLNVAMIARSPGPMAEGNWFAALYLDERANDDQQSALQAIFTGAAGGVMAGFAPLISEVLGVKTAPITYRIEDKRRSVEIPEIMSVAVHPAASLMGEGQEIVVTNAHPFAPDGLRLGIGDEGNTWSDYGMSWDNSGRNGHYAPIRWSNG